MQSPHLLFWRALKGMPPMNLQGGLLVGVVTDLTLVISPAQALTCPSPVQTT